MTASFGLLANADRILVSMSICRIIQNYCAVATTGERLGPKIIRSSSWSDSLRMSFSPTALLWFDFALTFTAEVRGIWRRRFSCATLIYLFMRYTALIDRVFFILMILPSNLTDQVWL